MKRNSSSKPPTRAGARNLFVSKGTLATFIRIGTRLTRKWPKKRPSPKTKTATSCPGALDLDDVYDDFCCLCECEPGERCPRHGNLYAVVINDEEKNRDSSKSAKSLPRRRETIIIQEEDPDRARDLGWNVIVPVRLKEEISTVHTKLATELRDMRDARIRGRRQLPAVSGAIRHHSQG